jgi:hypothetical protein
MKTDLAKQVRSLAKDLTALDPKTAGMLILVAKELEHRSEVGALVGTLQLGPEHGYIKDDIPAFASLEPGRYELRKCMNKQP